VKRLFILTFSILLCSTLVCGQRAGSKKANAKQGNTLPINARVPNGFVVVALTETSKTIKKPSERETICDGSPVPDGYIVIETASSTQCQSANSNPLVNAMVIALDGSTAASATVSPAHRRAATQYDDDDERSIRITIGNGSQAEKHGPRTREEIVELRAAEINQAAERSLAVKAHKIAIGMTMKQVYESWGRPYDIDKSSTSASGTSVTWWYRANNKRGYVRFKDGKVIYWSVDE
jgi:hypothetical protein